MTAQPIRPLQWRRATLPFFASALLLLLGAVPSPASAQEDSRPSQVRSKSSASPSRPSAAPGRPSAAPPRSSATPVRSSAAPNRPSAVRGSRTAVPRNPDAGAPRQVTRHRPGFRGGRRGSIHLGFYGYYGRYGYLDYYWPYYWYPHHYYYPYHPWGWVWYPAARYGGDVELGGLDLNVKPKKAAVWVDGEYVGTAGKFDGFPGYLWLESGRHQLVFHLPGYKTEVRELTVRTGLVLDLKFRMVDGESTPPEKLAVKRPAPPVDDRRPADRYGDRYAERDRDRDRGRAPLPPERPRAAEGREPQMDLRSEPGRFRVSVEPADASVYLDGRFLGSGTELAGLRAGMMVDPGQHVLEVSRPGYRTKRTEFSVEAGTETEINVRLEAE